MEARLSVVVIFWANLTVAQWFAVDRHDNGDIFGWYGKVEDNECINFSDKTAWPDDAGRCHCDWGLTFSTEDNKCHSYRDQPEGKYYN